ncbi:MAG: hypothetical protein H6507_08950 [Calditrichaeota bacterium]|nr:hypothetical protein [Calditrichota bacterium]
MPVVILNAVMDPSEEPGAATKPQRGSSLRQAFVQNDDLRNATRNDDRTPQLGRASKHDTRKVSSAARWFSPKKVRYAF